ncbi:MAG: CDP-alcohol phosphatidyltransferase family protein [Wenzhouxiangella sp.]
MSPQPKAAFLAWVWPAALPLCAAALLLVLGASWFAVLAGLVLYALSTAALARQRRRHAGSFGYASQVTLARSGLVAVLGGALLEPVLYQELGWWLAGLALAALILDGVDGWLARRLGESSDFGARFDMEVDAALIMVLCLGLIAADQAGIWVLAIGLMRYAFVAAARLWRWLEAPLPPSFRRKLVCVWQVAALLICITPLIGPAWATPILASALGLLTWSFWVDVAWLKRDASKHSSPT